MNIKQFVYIEICDTCNLKCIHCYNNSSSENCSYMSLESFNLLLSELKKHEKTNIVLSGGEPLTHPYFDRILLSALSQNFVVKVITNGVLAKNKLLSYALEYRDRVIVQISLDGSCDESNAMIRGKGVFKHALEFADLLSRNNYSNGIFRMTLHRFNYKEIADYFKLAVSYNFVPLFQQYIHLGRASINCNSYKLSIEQEKEISETIRECVKIYQDFIEEKDLLEYYTHYLYEETYECSLFKSFRRKVFGEGISIKCTGDVQPCEVLYDHCFTLGNILKEPLDKILCLERYARLNEKLVELSDKITNDNCLGCPAKALCRGGCLGKSYHHQGKYYTDSMCNKRIRLLLSQIPFSKRKKDVLSGKKD